MTAINVVALLSTHCSLGKISSWRLLHCPVWVLLGYSHTDIRVTVVDNIEWSQVQNHLKFEVNLHTISVLYSILLSVHTLLNLAW